MERGRANWVAGAAWPFVLLCVLGSSRWLLEGARPETASTNLTQAAGCLLAAGWLVLHALFFRRRSDMSYGLLYKPLPAVCAGLTIAGPSVWAVVSSRYIHAENVMLALALVPVVVAVAVPAFRASGSSDLAARLWPGLAGVTGLLLLVPQPTFSDWRFGLALAGMPVVGGTCAAFVSARSGSEARADGEAGDGFFSARALVVSAMCFGFLIVWVNRGQESPQFSWVGSALDGMTFLCMLAVLERLGAVRWSAQFLLIPLLTLLEGVVFLRPFLTTRSWLAFALLGVSSAYLLVASPGDLPAVTP